MFVTGYDEANRAYLRWYESDPEKSGKQTLTFISFSWEDGGKSSHSKPIIKVPNSARIALRSQF